MDDQRRAQLQGITVPFLACLLVCSLDDAWNLPVTFQTFTDVKPKPNPDTLAKVLHGSLDDHAEELERLSRAGAGVFVNVNGTDGKGRKKANVTQGRAWWADLDAKDAWEQLDLSTLPLAPTMVVKTPGGSHLYWTALEPMPFMDEPRRSEHEAEVKAIAEALKPYGCDRLVCDVSRVLRVPGYHHQKAEPRMVELLPVDGPRYSRVQVREAFPAVEIKASEPARATSRAAVTLDRAKVLDRAGLFLDALPEGIQDQGGSGATFNAALKIMDGFDLTNDEALDLLMDRYNPRCVPPWSLEELGKKVKDAAPRCRDRGHLLREGRERPGGAQRGPWTPQITNAITNCAVRNAPPSAGLPVPPETPPPSGGDDGRQGPGEEVEVRPLVHGFEWGARGLFYLKVSTGKDDEGKPRPPERVRIAPPFALPGLVRNDASDGWRLLIAWHDLDGMPHEEAMPLELLTGEGPELARTLAQGGMLLPPDPGLRKHLLRYLCEAGPKVNPRVRLVEALGWQASAFILPDGETIGHAGEPVRFAGELPGLRSKATKGTLEGWQQGVARFAVGNPRLAFALACAFAGPLLEMVRPDGGGGFNLMGFSSKGKSTCLEAAASVWGRPDPLPTWRATGNGLEGIAATRNDGFLVLDELSQVDPKEAGSVAYMLANGSAKARANREGGARTMRQWRLVFLSSGEQGLEDKMMEDGKRARAGQEVRVPDIPCPAEGMFEEAHGLPSLGALAEHLKAQARKHYGHAARAFLAGLCQEWEHRDALQAKLRAMEHAWLASALPRGVDAQVQRVAGRFALVAVAGELAQRMGILPWAEGDASSAALVCFKAWLDRRGFTGASEVHRGIEAVLAFLEKNGQARFDEYGVRDAHIINRAGTKKKAEGPVDGWDYFITAGAWKEACSGFSSTSVAKACADAGILEPGADGKHSRTVSIPNHGKPRCYVIRAVAVAGLNKEDAA